MNALVLPANSLQALTEVLVDLPLPPATQGTWRYRIPAQGSPAFSEKKCWIVHTQNLTDPITSQVDQFNQLSFEEAPPADYRAGDPLCPYEIMNFDLSTNREDPTVRLKLLTEQVPNMPDRHMIKYLSNYASFLEGPKNFIGLQLKMTLEELNAQGQPTGQTRERIVTFLFTINVINLRPSNQLAAYEVLGVHNGHVYAVVRTRLSYLHSRAQATLLGTYFHAQKSYLVEVNNQAENDFLASKINSGDRYWIGLQDADGPEGTFKWDSNGTSTYRSFAQGEPNNDGGEHFVHMNARGNKPLWNDTEGYQIGNAFIEMEISGDLANFR